MFCHISIVASNTVLQKKHYVVNTDDKLGYFHTKLSYVLLLFSFWGFSTGYKFHVNILIEVFFTPSQK